MLKKHVVVDGSKNKMTRARVREKKQLLLCEKIHYIENYMRIGRCSAVPILLLASELFRLNIF